MAAEIPYDEPLELVAGDTFKFRKTLADYTIADGWTLKYRIVGTSIALSITATDNGDGSWLVSIAAADLVAVVAETTARLIGWVEKSGERWTIYDDYVRVRPNVATATAANLKTHEVRTLEAIESVIEGRATTDLEQYQINGRAVTKIPILELLRFRGIYRAIVWKQQNEGVSHVLHRALFQEAG